jgi:hypothetical protein
MLSQHISWIARTRDKMKANEPSSHSFADTMKQKCSVSFVLLGLDLCGTVYHGFVVSKHLANFDNWNSKVLKSVAEIDDLLNACPGSNKLRPIGSRFGSRWRSIEKVKYPSD